MVKSKGSFFDPKKCFDGTASVARNRTVPKTESPGVSTPLFEALTKLLQLLLKILEPEAFTCQPKYRRKECEQKHHAHGAHP